jgi:hypothetical protein
MDFDRGVRTDSEPFLPVNSLIGLSEQHRGRGPITVICVIMRGKFHSSIVTPIGGSVAQTVSSA